MLNDFRFNQVLYNGETVNEANTSSGDLVSFDGFGLDNSVIFLEDVDVSGPNRQFESFDNPDSHGKTNTVDFFRQNTITLKGFIVKPTLAEAIAYRNTMLATLSQKEKYLQINEGDDVGRYKGTFINTKDAFRKTNEYKEVLPFNMQFLIEDPPFREDISVTSITESAVTLGSFLVYVENTGNVESYLDIVAIINSATSLSNIQIQNQTTGRTVRIARSYTAGEILRVNGSETKVYINSDVSNVWVGKIPELAIGINLLSITVTSSAHNIDFSFLTRNRYLL